MAMVAVYFESNEVSSEQIVASVYDVLTDAGARLEGTSYEIVIRDNSEELHANGVHSHCDPFDQSCWKG